MQKSKKTKTKYLVGKTSYPFFIPFGKMYIGPQPFASI